MEGKKVLSVNLSEGQSLVIPVIQEKLQIEKEVVESGKVQISKKVFEEETQKDVLILEEDIIVEKIAINKYVDKAPPAVRQDGNVTIVSVVKEVLVVEKRLMLVEELHITKQQTEKSVPIKATLLREEVDVRKWKME